MAHWDLCPLNVGQLPCAQRGLGNVRGNCSGYALVTHVVTAVTSSLPQLVLCVQLACLHAFTLGWRVSLFCYSCCHPWPLSEPSLFSLPMWSEDQRLSRNPPSRQCQIGTIEASSLVSWAAARFSASPVCRQLLLDYPIRTVTGPLHSIYHYVSSVSLENKTNTPSLNKDLKGVFHKIFQTPANSGLSSHWIPPLR